MRNSVAIANKALEDKITLQMTSHRAFTLLAMMEQAGYHKYDVGSTARETYEEIKRKIAVSGMEI